MEDWTLAARVNRIDPTALQIILKATEYPNIISFAGGLPSPDSFPLEAFRTAFDKVMQTSARDALQYSAGEGYRPLREWVAQSLPWEVSPDQVLITTGSQQALDLVGKIFIDEGSRIVVQEPSYLGALQAFSSYGPLVWSVPNDPESGEMQLDILEREQLQHVARFFYVLPNFQNPTGQTISEEMRKKLAETCHALQLPVIEDNPYGELWFDQPPPPPISSYYPENSVYLGSFSKVLAPGLRLGFMVVPPSLYKPLVQVKQASDLHSPGLNQRLALEVLQTPGFLEEHLAKTRVLYKSQCQTMLAALQKHMPENVTWNTPRGGMFLWLSLPQGMDSTELLPRALENGVAYVPGMAFYSGDADMRTIRLSFATASTEEIDRGIQILAKTIREAMAA